MPAAAHADSATETNSEVYVTVGGYLEIYPGMKNTRVSLNGLSWRADLRTEA